MVAAAVIAAGVMGAGATVYASDQSANAMDNASNNAVNAQNQDLAIAQGNTAYSRALGNGSDTLLSQLYGINLNNSGVNLATGANNTTQPGMYAGGGGVGGYSSYNPGTMNSPFSGGATMGIPGATPNAPGTAGASGGSQFTATKGGQIIPGVTGGATTNVGQPGSTSIGNNPNYNGFYNTPGFQFSLGLGNQAINRNSAASGGLYSTNTLAGLSQYNTGMASQQYQQYVGNLMQMAGLGTNASVATGNQAVQTGQGVSNSYTNAGLANASGAAASGGAIAGLANNQNFLNAISKLATPASTTPPATTTSGGVNNIAE